MNNDGILKSSMMLTLGRGTRTMLMLLFAMFATRYLSQGDYGTYKQMVLINTMLVAIIPLGLPISISYYYQNLSKLKQSSLVANTGLTSFVLSIICVAVMLSLKKYVILLFNNPSLEAHYYILCLYVFVTVFFSFIENLYVSVGSAVLLGKISVAFAFFFFSGILIATWLTRNLSFVFGWMFLSELVKYIVMCIILYRRHRYKLKIDWQFLKEQFVYCIPLGLVAIVQFVNNYLDKLFISNRFTADQYAVYINGATEIPFISLITVSIATVALPTLSRIYNTEKNIDGMMDVWKDTQKKTALLLYPVFWAMLLCSNGIILFLYSDKYAASVTIFIVFLFKMIMTVTVFSNLLIVLKKQKYILFNFCVTIVVNLALNIILTYYIGMIGAAVSSLFCHFFMDTLQLYQIGRFTGRKIRQLMPFKDLAKLLASGGAVALVLYLITNIFSFGHIPDMFIYGPLTLAGCFAVYFKLGYISKTDVKSVINKILRRKR